MYNNFSILSFSLESKLSPSTYAL